MPLSQGGPYGSQGYSRPSRLHLQIVNAPEMIVLEEFMYAALGGNTFK